jgi:hypothetical protein
MIAESEQKNPYIVERRYCIKILLYDVAFHGEERGLLRKKELL